MLTIAVWRNDRTIDHLSPRLSIKKLEFSSERELEEVVREHKLDAILVIAGPDGIGAVSALRRAARRKSSIQCPVIVDVPPGRLALDQLAEMIRDGHRVRPALRGFLPDALMQELASLPATGTLTAGEFLFAELVEKIPADQIPIVLPAFILGGKKVATKILLAASSRRERTVRNQLSTDGLPSPGKLLGLVAGFHVAYNTEVFGMTLGEAATVAGFDTEDALRKYLKPRSGINPGGWKKLGVFGSLLVLCTRLRLRDSSEPRRN